MLRTFTALAAVAVLGIVECASAQVPPPSLTVAGQKATFAPAVAFFDAETARVSVLFAHAPLSADAEARERATGSWEDAAGASAPSVIVDLLYTPGSTSGLVSSLKGCAIHSFGFKKDLNLKGANGQECHVLSIGGMIRTDGGIAGLLTGQSAQYSLYLPLAVSLPAGSGGDGSAARKVAKAAATLPLNTVKGTGTYQGQTIRATHALAWWDAEKTGLRAALFDHAPKAGTLTGARKGEYSGDDIPLFLLDIRFSGAGRDLSSADYCFVNTSFPKGGPIGTNTDPKGCGITSLITDGKPGGAAQVVMKGSMNGPDGPVTFDVQFHVPLAK